MKSLCFLRNSIWNLTTEATVSLTHSLLQSSRPLLYFTIEIENVEFGKVRQVNVDKTVGRVASTAALLNRLLQLKRNQTTSGGIRTRQHPPHDGLTGMQNKKATGL